MEYNNVDVTLADMLREALQIERGGLALARRRCCSFSRIVVLADAVAANPDWWRCNRLHFFCPELSHQQIADVLELPRRTVTRNLANVEIGDDVYKDLPDPHELEDMFR